MKTPKFYTVEEYEDAFDSIMENLETMKEAVKSWREEYPKPDDDAYWKLVDIEVALYAIDELLFGRGEEDEGGV